MLKYLPIPLCAALAVFFTYFPITDTDIFWHLAAGREMVIHRHFLFTDPFSFTLASPQWIDLHWLFQLIVYGLFMLGGLKAILAFKLFVVALVCIVLCLVFRSAKQLWVSAFLAAYLFYQARYLVLDRPVLITMVCMSLYLFLFENVRGGWKRQWLWLCIPLQIFWTNSQGLYPIGIFMIGAYWVELMAGATKRGSHPLPPRKLFTAIFLLSCLSCLATPYGLSGLTLPFKLFGRIAPHSQNIYSLNISENVPLLSLAGFEAGYRVIVIGTAIFVSVMFALNRRRIRVAHVLLFAGFLSLAFSAVRNVLLYFIVIIPIIASLATNADVALRISRMSVVTKRFLAGAAVLAGIVVLVKPVMDHAAVVMTYPPHRILSPFRFPEKITEYLKANPVPGEMFNDIRYGGYLIWEMYPQKKVFVDGRLVIRSAQFFEEYLAICEQPDLFPYVSKKFNITQVILPSAIFDRYLNLIKWLYNSSEWHLEFTDGSSFLFVRNDERQKPSILLSDPATISAISNSIRSEWHDAPEVCQEALGYFSDALRYLRVAKSAESAIH